MRFKLVLLMLLLCGANAANAQQQADDFPPPGEIYLVDGQQMHLYCMGEGSPTVILEAGVGGFSLNWRRVQQPLAASHRVCSYDRLGYGWSDPLPDGEFDFAEAVADLHALLTVAEVPPPYVLVGHSFGGALSRAYTQAHPEQVQGMVLLDAVPPNLAQEIPFYADSLQVQLAGLRLFGEAARLRAAQEDNSVVQAPSDMSQDVAEAYAAKLIEEKFLETVALEANYIVGELSGVSLPETLGDLPLVVLAHGIPERTSFLGAPLNLELAAEAERTWQRLQRELATLSTKGRFAVAEQSGHSIQFDQPDLVIEAIQEVIAAAD